METNTEKVMMKVTADFAAEGDGVNYKVELAKGSNANETAFCMAVVINALVIDKIVPDSETMIRLVRKYFDEMRNEK